MSSRISGFYKLDPEGRRNALAKAGVPTSVLDGYRHGSLSLDAANLMVENVVSTFVLPNAVAVNFKINGEDRLVPMVVEEPSVVAAVSNMARIARDGEGFVAESDPSVMIAQIQLAAVPDAQATAAALEAALPRLEAEAASVHPRLVERGGGVRGLEIRTLRYEEPGRPAEDMVVLHILLDCVDAMGANMLNTLAEHLAPSVTEITGLPVGLRILSNLADRRLSRARVRVDPARLASSDMDGREVAEAREALADTLAGLAEAHRATPMAARTRMQQATPTSFGLKAAVWLSALVRHLERLPAIRKNLLVLSFAGASGNLAALGAPALAVEKNLAARLDLLTSPAPWHSVRDGLLDYAGWLTLITGTLGKIGLDLSLLAQSEVGEVRLAGGGSSTMPNKVNPVGAEVLAALARMNAGQLGTLHQAALHEHERSGTGWTLEWLTLPQMVMATSGALKHANQLFDSLVVDEARMRANIEASCGLLLAEAASFALSSHMPRPEAQALVKKACATAAQTGRHLFDVLAEETDAAVAWQELRNPALHLGSGGQMIDRVLESYQAVKPSS